jgi:PAS domain S-box-containing protein
MSAVQELLKDFPQLAGHESLRQMQTEFERLRLQYETVKAEYIGVVSEHEALRRKVGARELGKPSTTKQNSRRDWKVVSEATLARVEQYGVLWRVARTGYVEPIAQCPMCSAALESFPPLKPALLRCQCGFVARDIIPEDVPRLALEVQRRITGTLADSEYRALLDQSPVMIWRSGIDGAVDYVNEMCVRFTGSPTDRQIGSGWVENVHPEDRESSVSIYRRSFDRRDALELRCRLRRPDGSYSPIISRGAPYYDDHGAFKGFIGGCVDLD